ESAGADGRLSADWGVFEIDEASLPVAVDEIQPKAVIVLNLFRDQLDRYGELESIAKRIESALERMPAGSRALLNADDPRVAEIGLDLPAPPLWLGIEDTSVAERDLPHAADARTCPRCGASLIFDAVYVGHDGVYRCPNKDFRGRHLNLVLSKNPAGFNETLRTAVDLAKGNSFLIALNDRKADGTDVSWIWDVDFERLKGKATVLVPAGSRAHDLAVRFKYAGIDAAPPEPDPGRALD